MTRLKRKFKTHNLKLHPYGAAFFMEKVENGHPIHRKQTTCGKLTTFLYAHLSNLFIFSSIRFWI